jgi:hypothetical protein
VVDRPRNLGQPQDRSADELLDLIWGLCDGNLDADSAARLNERLLTAGDDRSTYVSFLQLAAWLEYEQPAIHSLVSATPSASVDFLPRDAARATEDASGGQRSFVPNGALSGPAVDAMNSPSPRGRAPKRSAVKWLSVTACGVLAAVVAGLALRDPPEPAANTVTGPRSTAVQELLDIITIRLATAESRTLPIADFGTVSIQGPAHLDLIGNSRARLYQGRIKVRINDERGHGFVVETPNGQVTDLGTEFGVDVADDSNTGVVVFEGAVDLAVHPEQERNAPRIERLIQGEGLTVYDAGRRLDRIMSVITGNVSTFQRRGETRLGGTMPVIADVSDNIRSSDFKKFYEIVPAGLREDALAYADRPLHEWNGMDANGLPPYLVGADYVKPFNSDKMRKDVELSVSLATPARLFVLLDDRVSPPDWLRDGFRDTGDDIGLDCGPFKLDGVEIYFDHSTGAGQSVEVRFSVWERIVNQAGTIRLGPNSGATFDTGMYAVAAIPLIEEASAGTTTQR